MSAVKTLGSYWISSWYITILPTSAEKNLKSVLHYTQKGKIWIFLEEFIPGQGLEKSQILKQEIHPLVELCFYLLTYWVIFMEINLGYTVC